MHSAHLKQNIADVSDAIAKEKISFIHSQLTQHGIYGENSQSYCCVYAVLECKEWVKERRKNHFLNENARIQFDVRTLHYDGNETTICSILHESLQPFPHSLNVHSVNNWTLQIKWRIIHIFEKNFIGFSIVINHFTSFECFEEIEKWYILILYIICVPHSSILGLPFASCEHVTTCMQIIFYKAKSKKHRKYVEKKKTIS